MIAYCGDERGRRADVIEYRDGVSAVGYGCCLRGDVPWMSQGCRDDVLAYCEDERGRHADVMEYCDG